MNFQTKNNNWYRNDKKRRQHRLNAFLLQFLAINLCSLPFILDAKIETISKDLLSQERFYNQFGALPHYLDKHYLSLHSIWNIKTSEISYINLFYFSSIHV